MEDVSELVERVRDYYHSHDVRLASLDADSMANINKAQKVMEVELAELEHMVRRDSTVTADLIRLANSSMHKRAGVPLNLHDVLVRLGRQEVYGVFVSAALRNLMSRNLTDLYLVFPHRWHDCHQHMITCAFTTGWLAERQQWVGYDCGFLGGMFHDIGRLLALEIIGLMVVSRKLDPERWEVQFSSAIEALNRELGVQALKGFQMPAYVQHICEQYQVPPVPDRPLAKLVHGVRVVSSLDLMVHDRDIDNGAQRNLDVSVTALRFDDATVATVRDKVTEMNDRGPILMVQ